MPRKTHKLALVSAGLFAALTGCVERTITITSEPSGALVYLNDREIGRTPVDVEFLHYGEYDVRLVKEGYEPQMTSGDANAPIWDLPGPDFFAEVFPANFKSEITWHYVLEPVKSDPQELVDRAREMRQRLADESAIETVIEATPPATEADASPANDLPGQ